MTAQIILHASLENASILVLNQMYVLQMQTVGLHATELFAPALMDILDLQKYHAHYVRKSLDMCSELTYIFIRLLVRADVYLHNRTNFD